MENLNKTTEFKDLSLHPLLLKAVQDAGYVNPTPIQEQSIPLLLAKKDLLGCAQTGTGKTAAFALPILHNLLLLKQAPVSKKPKVLVLSPTRELAVQIHESFVSYGKLTPLKSAVIYGGVSQQSQVRALSQGVDILVATPGRLLDLLNQRCVNLSAVSTFVLDEADRMLDMGFIADIKKLLPLLPAHRHNLFFSATMPNEITRLAEQILDKPTKIEITPQATTAEKVEQSVYFVDKAQKRDLLRFLLKSKELSKVIVFTRTKHGANRVTELLQKNQIPSEAIHGNKSQNARQRALENLRSGQCRVLIATDIAARGIDIDGITHVINFELPNIAESYVHRIGRTARAGTTGKAISFCDLEEKAYLADIEKITSQKIPVIEDHPFHSQEIMGARAMSKGKAKAMIEGKSSQRSYKPKGSGNSRWHSRKKSPNTRS